MSVARRHRSGPEEGTIRGLFVEREEKKKQRM
eukprot:COSAG01_NODE_64941_length_274_cov_40.205714_1_plen_31_part_10